MSQSTWQTLANRTRQMATDALADVKSLEDWKRQRPALLKEFMHALGLDPLPPRCEPRLTEHGEFSGPGYRARKIAYQMLPDCWSTATIYYPADLKPGDAPAPGVLYVCGHAPLPMHRYQYHPLMWARRGYVCLIVETIEQGDNPGEHHGSLMNQEDCWLSLGYTTAGTEAFNSMRALDILAEDPLVDAQKLGVTGVSGGGASSFYLAIIDERVKALSSLCGVSTPVDAVEKRHLLNHCDCFYPHNIYGRDISVYAALIAPRAAAFCFADHDPLFHPTETRAFVDRTRKIYELYGNVEDCSYVSCPGQHGDHPPLDEATSRLFDEKLAGEARPMVARGERENSETTVDIFQGVSPVPNLLHLLPELLSPQGQVPLPMDSSDWPRVRHDALAQLRRWVPAMPAANDSNGNFTCTGDWLFAPDMGNKAYRGELEGQDMHLQLILPDESRHRLIISVVNEGQNTTHGLGALGRGVDITQASYGGFEPRMAGSHAPASHEPPHPPGSSLMPARVTMLRYMAVAGLSPILMTIRDILALTSFFKSHADFRDTELYFYGLGDAGVAALYAGLLDDRIAGVVLENVPSSHRHSSPIPGVLRAFDMPQAVGLMAPRKVALIKPGHRFWTWPTRAYERVGCEQNLVVAPDLRRAVETMLAD